MNPTERQAALTHLTTVADWLRWSFTMLSKAQVYLGHGVDSVWDESLQLVLGALSLPLECDEVVYQAALLPEERERIFDWVERRTLKREPLAYITQTAWFMGMPFYVDDRVLVPRSPFGEWIERGFEPWVNAEQVHRICEIGTGSGCMAIAAAMVFEDAQVDAVDISGDALAVASKNIEEYDLQDRVRLFEGDALSAVGDQCYDIIMSNPPYVPDEEEAGLPAEYRHEPANALFAGHDGMAIVSGLIEQAANHLTDHGVLFVEVGQFSEAVTRLYPDLPLTWLSCAQGGEGIFMITKEQLLNGRQT
mgnify:CR=1 FL=1